MNKRKSDSFFRRFLFPKNLRLKAIGGIVIFCVFLSCNSGTPKATSQDKVFDEMTEKIILAHLEKLNADSGMILLMNVKSGTIVSKCSATKIDSGYVLSKSDQMLSTKIEPGNLFSLVVFMAALKSGKVSPKDSFDTGRGLYETGGIRIMDSNYDVGGFGRITLADAVVKGSNIGLIRAIELAYGDSIVNLGRCFRKMSLGEPEIESVNFQGGDPRLVSLGLGMKLSPLQLITFYNAIANNGRMVYDKKVHNPEISDSGTIRAVQKVLKEVVLNGTGKRALADSISIAGKTGSVEIWNRDNGNHRYYLASFCGYFPADNPQYTCLVMIFNPKVELPYGGRVAAPIFKEIAENISRK